MSVLEMVRSKVKELTDPNGPANGLLHSAKSAVAQGLDGASKFVDEKTNGKYSSQINTGVHKAKEFLGEEQDKEQKQEPGAAAEGAAADAAAETPKAETPKPETPESETPTPTPTTEGMAPSAEGSETAAPEQPSTPPTTPPTTPNAGEPPRY